MLDKIKNLLGDLSGYKGKYERSLEESNSKQDVIDGAVALVDDILHLLYNWDVNR